MVSRGQLAPESLAGHCTVSQDDCSDSRRHLARLALALLSELDCSLHVRAIIQRLGRHDAIELSSSRGWPGAPPQPLGPPVATAGLQALLLPPDRLLRPSALPLLGCSPPLLFPHALVLLDPPARHCTWVASLDRI